MNKLEDIQFNKDLEVKLKIIRQIDYKTKDLNNDNIAVKNNINKLAKKKK